MTELIKNIDKVHTTELGVYRISKNLSLDNVDAVQYCKSKIIDKNSKIVSHGKNWYIYLDGDKIVVNRTSYTIITAHKIKQDEIF